MSLEKRMSKCKDFACVFEIVKECVDETVGKKRSSMMLGLTDMPINIAAFHPVPSNFIMVNRKLLEAISGYNRKLVNAYVFSILLHEYLHSIGYLNEEDTQTLTYVISKKFFGENHPATLIAKYGMGVVFPELRVTPEFDNRIEIVRDFDPADLSYIG